jgi:hypothetical protein
MITTKDICEHGSGNIVQWLDDNHIEYSWAKEFEYSWAKEFDPSKQTLVLEWAIMSGGSDSIAIIISKNDYMRFKLAF